jgi:hypothetical protein
MATRSLRSSRTTFGSPAGVAAHAGRATIVVTMNAIVVSQLMEMIVPTAGGRRQHLVHQCFPVTRRVDRARIADWNERALVTVD